MQYCGAENKVITLFTPQMVGVDLPYGELIKNVSTNIRKLF